MVVYNMNRFLIAFSLLLFVSVPAFAADNITQYCADSSVLTNVDSWSYCEDNKCEILRLESNTSCDFGCEKDKCVEPPMNSILIVLGFFIAIIVALFFIRRMN
jgi:hypothetical protein